MDTLPKQLNWTNLYYHLYTEISHNTGITYYYIYNNINNYVYIINSTEKKAHTYGFFNNGRIIVHISSSKDNDLLEYEPPINHKIIDTYSNEVIVKSDDLLLCMKELNIEPLSSRQYIYYSHYEYENMRMCKHAEYYCYHCNI